MYGTRVPGDRGKFRTSAHMQPKYTVEEVGAMVHGMLRVMRSLARVASSYVRLWSRTARAVRRGLLCKLG